MAIKVNGVISNKITGIHIALSQTNSAPANVSHEGQLIGDISSIGWNTFELECDGVKYGDCRLTNIPYSGSFRYKTAEPISE